jgi:hypothetical protein
MCTVLYYTVQHSYGNSEQRCRCQFHGLEFFPSATSNSTQCPVGIIEDRFSGIQSALEAKVKDLEDRIDQHEQDYYNAQHPQNVRTG